MPTSPGMTLYPGRSRTCASFGTFADPDGAIDSILPFDKTTVWSSRGVAPVPSITRTCVSATTPAFTLTNGCTCGDKDCPTAQMARAKITIIFRMVPPDGDKDCTGRLRGLLALL